VRLPCTDLRHWLCTALAPRRRRCTRARPRTSSYHAQADVLVTLFHSWTATTHHIASITASNRTLKVGAVSILA